MLRQDSPDSASYWERHRLELEPDMNVTSVLQRIAAQAAYHRWPRRGAGGL